MSQTTGPNGQRPAICCSALKGMTTTATRRSATASETRNELAMMRSRSKRIALTMTSMLPQTAATMIIVIASALNKVAATSPALGDVRGTTHDDWLSAQLKLNSYQSSYSDSFDHLILPSWRAVPAQRSDKHVMIRRTRKNGRHNYVNHPELEISRTVQTESTIS